MIKIIFSILFLLVTLSYPQTLYASPPSGNYLELNGGFIKGENTDNSSPPAFTFEAWIKPNSLGGLQHIMTLSSPNQTHPNYQLSINGGSLQLTYTYSVNALRQIVTGNLSSGNWQHIAAVISPSSTVLFLNGTSLGNFNGSYNLKPIGPDIFIGSDGHSSIFSSNIFKGSIDQVRISKISRNIPANWQNNLYLTDLSADSEAILIWNLNQARGEISATDDSNHINGLLVGGDLKIHFYGVLPTATPFVLPTLRPLRTISLFPQPTLHPGSSPTVTIPEDSWFTRLERPLFRR
ncbi:hypothetical protein A3J20_07225 [Candidatus Gottesmanbacteria bacterium RIFCSPLOWO2_02_FULL_42_29]|uniref:LamG-like jellyroll fold domain-containing protein n=2 Tax=Candidatus Gottesmaniibacteriota TaxID=1752720 RepID=A0A1F6B9F6_9BACT|nr:MAG: hypothetical protein UV09_C0007G0006 [Candidatus Gottesmanbacteria bacterium GW2011_GWA2_42_18]KKS74491.1 MAG: hypothetical protein UV46_C0042G0006 [Candidatus Gottesmanbacteria bacterium GW2011_GWC2_42_8]OGG10275.1 MAG: hypothetical protein A2781_01100 [Candidatus Gottesmanbacteria bacterium RIFCSPHIGHO2_01_FULL_42_27]OGG20306.1 MAG: hypothetical protein A3E72_04225 [Candidatus Gottesmanbacteria bacterium RIFCSPHIGHO2_12_FULL_43_26]OGG33443.1 MAG: hypothetical protein A2968_02640 [Cand